MKINIFNQGTGEPTELDLGEQTPEEMFGQDVKTGSDHENEKREIARSAGALEAFDNPLVVRREDFDLRDMEVRIAKTETVEEGQKSKKIRHPDPGFTSLTEDSYLFTQDED